MANSTSSVALAADNPNSISIQSEVPPIVEGVVRHPHVCALVQVTILRIVDETGSATIGDIMAGLPGREDPVGAVLALVAAGVLVLELHHGVLDEHATVRRVMPEPDPDDAVAPVPVSPVLPDLYSAVASGGSDVPDGIESLGVAPFIAHVVVGSGARRRAFGRMPALRRPGIYALMSATAVYVGMGGDVGARVADGRQPIEDIEQIVVITDALGNLTSDHALVAERNLSARIGTASGLTVINEVPIGAPCVVQLYSEVDAFVGEACLRLHHHGFFLADQPARAVLAGPRTEPGRLGPARLFDTPPAGELFELHFGNGLVALAAKQDEDRWLVLRGSHVRIEAAPSGNRGIIYSRAAWLHAGLITLAPDGRSYIVERDLVFPTGSSAAQFCSGVKGKPLSKWRPIDRDVDENADLPDLAAA